MAAPTPTAPGTPAGIKLRDGFSTEVTFASLTTASFWEKTVKPAGMDGGDKIEQTTMRNTAWRTFAPRSLKTMTDCSLTCAYDPNVLASGQLQGLINHDDTITIRFPDGSTWAIYGYLKSFEPKECKEGEQPEIDLTIVFTNWDNSAHVEAGPVVTSVSGT